MDDDDALIADALETFQKLDGYHKAVIVDLLKDFGAVLLDRAAAGARAGLEAENARLRAALKEMVYETTHLSPLEDDGSHRCRISRGTLAQARAVLSPSA